MANEIIPADDPNRCQALAGNKQCRNEAVEGCTVCESHGGRVRLRSLTKRQYDIDDSHIAKQYQRFADHEAIYSLRDEIALVRTLISNSLKNIADDPLTIPAILSMTTTLEKLVKTSATTEYRLGQLLSKDAVTRILQQVIVVINNELIDLPDHTERADRIVAGLARAVQEESNRETDG